MLWLGDGRTAKGSFVPSKIVFQEECLPPSDRRSEQKQNLELRAKKIARCNWTLTFILALTGRGRGDRKRRRLCKAFLPWRAGTRRDVVHSEWI